MMVQASGPCGAYGQLAELSADTLRACRERDWEAFTALREREAALLSQLRATNPAQGAGQPDLARIKALIEETLSNQREAQALLAPWREEIAAQLRSAGSSRKLARAYGSRANSPA
jgi:hypothetical protein